MKLFFLYRYFVIVWLRNYNLEVRCIFFRRVLGFFVSYGFFVCGVGRVERLSGLVFFSEF